MRLIFRKTKDGKVFVAFPFEKWRYDYGCRAFSVEKGGFGISYRFLYHDTLPAKPTSDRKLLGYVMEWDGVEILDTLPPIEMVSGSKKKEG